MKICSIENDACVLPIAHVHSQPSVSLVTVSQYSRKKCINLLVELINQQSYSNIIEWIIVEGSSSAEQAFNNQQHIEWLRTVSKIPINYIAYVANSKLGALRNRGNDHANGQIIVCMDDDDYYPAVRVEHAVERLMSSECMIAGCNLMYIYDYHLDAMIQFWGLASSNGGMVEHHAANNSFAYKHEYLKLHRYDDEADAGEEAGFTNNFTEPMVQLDSDKSVICSSHGSNTYAKRALFTYAAIGDGLIYDTQLIDWLLPKPVRDRYKYLFYIPSKSEYEIVYYAGGFGIPWDPRSEALGGSEQAIVNLAEQWHNLGKKVCVYLVLESKDYLNIQKQSLIHNGVEYFDWRVFDFSKIYHTLIVWRAFNLKSFLLFQPAAQKIYLDLHDGAFDANFVRDFNNTKSLIDKVFVKSEFHKTEFMQSIGDSYTVDDVCVIPNGVNVAKFLPTNVSNLFSRDKFRFCYTSCYSRGLVNLLSFTWPLIYQREPRAELHIYYGMQYLQDPVLKATIQVLLTQPGVMDHGRQAVDLISREKWRANFHLYVTDSIYETDCISVKESLVAGAIPIISNSGVFAERDGYHFSIDNANPTNIQLSYQNLAHYCLELLEKSDAELNQKRSELSHSNNIVTWQQVAKQWLVFLSN